MTHKKIDDVSIYTYNSVKDRRKRSEEKETMRERWLTLGILFIIITLYYTFV